MLIVELVAAKALTAVLNGVLLGAQRLRVEEFLTQAHSQSPKAYILAARVKRKGSPHDSVPVGFPAAVNNRIH